MSIDVLKTIWPEWQIEKQLGKGSYGVVYKAVRKDHNVESYAAIKVISIPGDSSEVDTLRSEGLDVNATKTYLQGIVDDFVGEIQLMESLKGIQNIVSVEDYKVIEKTGEIGWEIYIRMELLIPFNNFICDNKLTEEDVIRLGCDICTALEICRKRNIIHRDIKPENIFINGFGHFKLGDFGIARKLENMSGGLSQKGTFNYMAPEVANSNEYDERVDIYSLGIVLYRLLNENRLPLLDAETQLSPNERRNAVERRIHGEALPAPCEASSAMADVILRACAYDPQERFASPTEMKEALLSVAKGTYQMGGANLDQTMSVQPAKEVNVEATAVVRKKGKADVQNATAAVRPANGAGVQQTVDTFGEKSKKKTKKEKKVKEKKVKEKQTKEGKEGKKRKKGKFIAIFVLVCILAGAVALAVNFFSSAAYSVQKAMKSKNFEKALSVYHEDVEDSFIQKLLLDTVLKGRVDDVSADYNSGALTYASAEEALKALDEMGFEGAVEKLAEIMESYANETVTKFENGEITCEDAVAILESLGENGYQTADEKIASITAEQVSDDALAKGNQYYENGEYEDAISELSKIPEDNKNYAQAQEKLNKVYADYIASVVTSAKKCNSSGKYEDAISQINAAYKILPDSVDTADLNVVKEDSLTKYKTLVTSEVKEFVADDKYKDAFNLIAEALAFDDNQYFRDLKSETEEKYVETITEEVQGYMDTNDFNSALKVVNNALGILPGNEALTELKNTVETETPTYLENIVVIDSGDYSYNEEVFTDSFGNIYDGCHWFDPCYKNAYVIFNLDDKYTEFKCSLVAAQSTGSDREFTVTIYLDGKLAYTISDFTKTTGKQDITLDVSNVTKLEIKTSADEYSYSSLAIVNASVK